jgi:hypothetical protein
MTVNGGVSGHEVTGERGISDACTYIQTHTHIHTHTHTHEVLLLSTSNVK